MDKIKKNVIYRYQTQTRIKNIIILLKDVFKKENDYFNKIK